MILAAFLFPPSTTYGSDGGGKKLLGRRRIGCHRITPLLQSGDRLSAATWKFEMPRGYLSAKIVAVVFGQARSPPRRGLAGWSRLFDALSVVAGEPLPTLMR